MRRFIALLFIFVSSLFGDTYEMTLQAMKYDQEGNYKQALQLYLKLHQVEPLNRQYMNQIGYLYYKIGNNAKAKEYFELTLKWYSDDTDARVWLGYIYYKEKDYTKAISFIKPVADSYPLDIKTQILLAEIQIDMGDREAALKTVERALKKDPTNTKLMEMQGNLLVTDGRYHQAFRSYKQAWEVSSKESLYLDQMIGVRDFSRLALKTYTSFMRENEIDLITGDFTTQVNTWYNGLEFSIPFPDAFRFYAKGAQNQEQQYNKIADCNNYSVNKYAAVAGMEYQYLDTAYVKLESKQKWGTGSDSEAIFPFDNRFVWQPKFELGVSSSHITYGARLYKDSFIGRNFNNTTSYFVFKKGVMNELRFRFFDGLTQFGAQGSMNLVSGSIVNRLKNFQGFFTQKIDICPVKAILEYRYLWGSYKSISEDYFSYRARYRNEGGLTLQLPFGLRHLISLRYTYKWQKLRDFNNVAEEITRTNIVPPQQIGSNIMHANEWELVLKASLREHLTLEGSCLYYHDTNQYQIFNGRFSLNFYF